MRLPGGRTATRCPVPGRRFDPGGRDLKVEAPARSTRLGGSAGQVRPKNDADSEIWWGGPHGPQPTPGRLAVFLLRNSDPPGNYTGMTFYRRRLPHFYEIDQPVFLTWRLHDSLP